ncbi:hypothetical protein BDW42DRAFT_176777 [Aspergillus taichungensis]|uniref:Uncharacterized protein n=1 Tax=Aspergillus taichungensis TaxID=482145 RepID=A0A2J5HK67_9EURO|nr:hypothetical protein BDW42DRAFT_176777 [Aspergillus taichungensis]
MCLAGDFADVYPIEIRTRKVTSRTLFNLGTEPSRRTQAQDRGRYQQASYSRPRTSRTMRVPKCHIIEPRTENRKCHAGRSPSARHSISRSQSFHFDLPSIRRFTDRAADDGLRSSRRRDRSPHPFAVDSPEVITMIPRRSRMSTFTQTCSDSTTTSDSDEFEDTESESESEGSSSCSPRYSRPSWPTRNTRPPRERTPVSERKPMRTGQRRIPSRPVEIHQSSNSIHDSNGERDMGRQRQVRFSEEVEYVQNTNRARDSIARKLGGRRRTSLDHLNQETRRVPGGNRRDSFNSSPSLRSRSPPFRETCGTERTFANPPGTGYMPSRIIQDGRRQIREAAGRIYAEARLRRSYADLRNNLGSYTVWGRSRPSDRLRESRFDDLRASFDHTKPFGYGRRWRWR